MLVGDDDGNAYKNSVTPHGSISDLYLVKLNTTMTKETTTTRTWMSPLKAARKRLACRAGS
jgi:hypothetical protein